MKGLFLVEVALLGLTVGDVSYTTCQVGPMQMGRAMVAAAEALEPPPPELDAATWHGLCRLARRIQGIPALTGRDLAAAWEDDVDALVRASQEVDARIERFRGGPGGPTGAGVPGGARDGVAGGDDPGHA